MTAEQRIQEIIKIVEQAQQGKIPLEHFREIGSKILRETPPDQFEIVKTFYRGVLIGLYF